MINQKFHTPCKNCVFITYEDLTQIDCKLNLIEKFRTHNIEILEAYDEKNEFYIINNTKCIHKRTKEWIAASLTLPEQVDKITKETNLHFHTIVWIKNEDNIENVKITLNSLNNQSLKPSQITLIRPVDCVISPEQLVESCSILDCKWRIERLIDKTIVKEKVLNLIIPFLKNKIYIEFNAGFIVPKETLNDISKAVIDDFVKFVMFLPNKDGNGLTTLNTIGMHYANYPGKSLQEKLEKDGCPSELLIPITKLLPYFPK